MVKFPSCILAFDVYFILWKVPRRPVSSGLKSHVLFKFSEPPNCTSLSSIVLKLSAPGAQAQPPETIHIAPSKPYSGNFDQPEILKFFLSLYGDAPSTLSNTVTKKLIVSPRAAFVSSEAVYRICSNLLSNNSSTTRWASLFRDRSACSAVQIARICWNSL